jgi:DNA-directed RNA polymerase subunit RPC12/RpoP
MKLFWSTCPKCERAFVVAWELRFDAHELWCPYCAHRYLASKSLRIDDGGTEFSAH